MTQSDGFSSSSDSKVLQHHEISWTADWSLSQLSDRSSSSQGRPAPQYGVKRLYPPRYRPACGQKVSSGPWVNAQATAACALRNSPLCPSRTLSLVPPSGDRDRQLWRTHVHNCLGGKERSSCDDCIVQFTKKGLAVGPLACLVDTTSEKDTLKGPCHAKILAITCLCPKTQRSSL